MRVRIRDVNDYTKLQDTPVDPDEARRAVSHFIQRSEQGREIPEDLMAFILAGLKRQLASDEGGWFPKEEKRGRRNHDRYLAAKAWYCFHISDEFRDYKGDDRYAPIGEHLKAKLDVLIAAAEKDWPEVKDVLSRTGFGDKSMRRGVKDFAINGFLRPSDTLSAEDAKAQNLVEARLFCAVGLGMDKESARLGAVEILDYWSANYECGQK